MLVIEDDPWNAKLMINILKDRVRQLKVCINAEEAITYLKTAGSDVDLIMTDISLPKMDGIQFFKLIRKLGYNMPVVAITAHVLKNKKTEMLSKGFSDIIIKPFQVNDITRVLRQHFIANEVPNTGIAHSGKKYEALWVFAGKDELSYQKLVADFKSSLQTKYQDFEIATKERNAQKVSTLAHQMKSAFEQININSFSEGFQSIVLYGELDKRDRLFEEAKDILQQLGKVIDNI